MKKITKNQLEYVKFSKHTLFPQKYKCLQEEHYALKEICNEQEKTLEELGAQLSTAKLAAVELKEAQQLQSPGTPDGGGLGTAAWANDRMVTQCIGCSREFNLTRRKVIKLFNYLGPRVLIVYQ